MSSQRVSLVVAAVLCSAATTFAQVNTAQLGQSGWYSDDTRADGSGSQPAGTNLISPALTDDPEATASGNPAHDADIRAQITFGPAPGVVPAGTHRGAAHLAIAAGAGAGKSQASHRKDDGTGHAAGADAFGPAMSMQYSWMGDGTVSVTASVKLGVKTSDFGSTGVSSRTGENAWDKVLIYEPGNLNGGTSNGLWQTESVDFTTGKWWFFDRTAGASIIGTPMTLSDMSTSPVLVGAGPKTVADVYALITAPGAHVTSVQIGIGSGNAGGSVYVNELQASFYEGGTKRTFGAPVLEYDQDVTNNVIFGSGNVNGSFTTDRTAGIEIGLRGKLRFDSSNLPQNVFNSNGDGTYTFNAGAPTGGAGWVTPNTPIWNFEWSVNSDFDGSSALVLDGLTYELGVDFDPGAGTNYLAFDPITPGAAAPYWDHAIGTNATGPGAGTTAPDAPTYIGLLAANNLAQNSWNMEFFNDPPFDVFDPNATGRYELYLAAYIGAVEVARSHITILVERPLEYDQDVTSNAIFGSGNVNGNFTTDRSAGVELGLRGKLRFPPSNVFNSNGDGTYTFNTGSGTSSFPNPEWAFEWSANTDFDASAGWVLDDLTYEFGMDFDPGAGTNYLVFDPITSGAVIPFVPPVTTDWWDHSIGNNATAQGAGIEATDLPSYLNLLANYNLAQNSWRLTFFDEVPFNVFDPNVPGRYELYLAASSGGTEVARTRCTVLVFDGATLSLEAEPCQTDADPSLPGIQIEAGLWMRNPGQDVTGFQAFLAFDAAALTYEGTGSSYTGAPFNLHIQDITTANVAPGELRLDGSLAFLSPPADQDALLATLVFTVAAECVPVSLDFDLTQAFSSELSYQGMPIATSLLDSPAILPDVTPPIVTVPDDITVAADASIGGGCASAVVNYTATAVDTCSVVSLVCTPPSGSAFPAGQTTTVTCVATDACGNTTVATFDVTVTSTNVVELEVQLLGVTTPVSRCIRFVTDTCGNIQDVLLDFDASGHFSGQIEVPCGPWTSLCAKDRQHTKWASTTLGLSGDGTKYVANAVLDLAGGDTDDDGDIDINDVTWLIFQYGQLAQPGGCPWDGTTRDADFSNNGAVGAEDYSFLTANWLTTSSCACADLRSRAGAGSGGPPLRRTRMPVMDAASAAADLNADGEVDVRDVEIFEALRGLPDSLSSRMRRTR